MEKEEQDGLKVIKASAQNFKNITYKEVEFNGRSAIIAGPNEIGKSSLIQAILSPLNAKFMPVEPIKKGEEKGKLELTIAGKINGEEQHYVISTYFSPEHSRGRLVMESEGGAKISGGKATLNEIIGNISFDVFEFIRLGRTEGGKASEAGVKKQIELLKSFMPNDVLRKLHELDAERAKKYSTRTDVNSEVKYIDSLIKGTHYTVEQIEKYSEPQSALSIQESIDKAKKRNDNYDACEKVKNETPGNIKDFEDDINLAEAKIKELQQMIEKYKSEIESANKKCKQAVEWMEGKAKVDLKPLYDSFDGITEHNSHVEKIKALKEHELNLKKKQDESNQITKDIEKIDQDKKDIFKSSTLPVPGLEFDENQVLFEGLPFNEDQIPTSRLIEIGLRLGAALNPNLRLMVIKDGSLLDKKAMDHVLDFCDKNNYQILVEMVSTTDTELSIEFIEK
jgi:hypothetical protein